jgi:hypothetical protein
MGTALANGDSVILVATLSHGNTLGERLKAEGYNVAEAIERGRYSVLEPAYLLSEFLVNGQPDSARFMKTAANPLFSPEGRASVNMQARTKLMFA